MAKYTINVEKPAVKEKIAKIEQTVKEIKEYKTVAILDLRKLPDALLQGIRKKLRGKGKIVVAKKPVLERILKSDKRLAAYVSEAEKPIALILTNLSPFELNRFLKENKKRRAAKTGEIAPFEISIPEGETDLPPGPALSELKSAGINVQIKAGKIIVAKESVVAKTGEVITDVKSKALQKLGIMPFEVGAKLIMGYDKEYVYNVELLNIDDHLNSDMQHAVLDGFNFSINANYPTAANTSILLQQAYMQSVNVALNGSLYSTSTMGQLLTSAARQGLALKSLG